MSARSLTMVVVRIAVVLLSVVAVLVAVVTIKTVIETKRDTERFTTRKSPTPLIGGILSNLSVSEFKAFIEPHYSWEDISNSGKSDFGGWRPPYDVTNLLIRDYSHLGFKGRLMVNFFNDRLDSGIFFPKDFDGYLDALSSMIGKKSYQTKKYISRLIHGSGGLSLIRMTGTSAGRTSGLPMS